MLPCEPLIACWLPSPNLMDIVEVKRVRVSIHNPVSQNLIIFFNESRTIQSFVGSNSHRSGRTGGDGRGRRGGCLGRRYGQADSLPYP